MVAVISIVAFKYARSLDKALNFALFWFVACYLVKCTTVNTRSKKKDLNFRFNPKVSSQFTETTLVLCPRFAALFLSLPYFFFFHLFTLKKGDFFSRVKRCQINKWVLKLQNVNTINNLFNTNQKISKK